MRTSTRARTRRTSSFAERAKRAWGGSSPSARRSSARGPRSSSQTGTRRCSRSSGSTRTRRRRTTTSTRSRALLAHPRAVAVGETGLDFFRDYAPHDRQRRALPAAARARRRAREAGRDPQPRRRRGRARGARVVRRNRRAALLLVSLGAPGRARPRVLRLVRRQRDVQERVGAARRGDAGPARPHPHRDRRARTSRPSRCAVGRTSPRTSCTRWRRSRTREARRRTSSPRRSTRTPSARSVCREHRAEEGARPALPRRREHPRRDRPARRARRRGRRARGRARARRPDALPRGQRRARARGRARPLARAEAPRGAGREPERRASLRRRAPPRSRRRSIPPRRSSSRTCRTTSRRRSSRRASTACRASSTGR